MIRTILLVVLVILIGVGAYFAYDAFTTESTMEFSAVSTDRSYGFVTQNADLYIGQNASIRVRSERIVQRFFNVNVMDDEPICPFELVFPDLEELPGYDRCLPASDGYVAYVAGNESDGDPTTIISSADADRLIFVLGFPNPPEANTYADLLVEQLNLSPNYPYSEVRVGAGFIGSRLNADSNAQVYHHTGWNTTLEGYRNTLIIVDREYVFVARSMNETQGQTYDLRAVTSDRIYARLDS